MPESARRRPPISLPDPGSLSRDELRRLGKAERKLASADWPAVVAGHGEVQAIERGRAERVEALSLAARLAETSALALSRGEEVRSERVRSARPVRDDHGARVTQDGAPVYRQETVSRIRILSRGGLQLAYERGDLDGARVPAEQLLRTAKAYRWAYETAAARTTPARDLASISARSPLRASAGPQDAVFAAGETLRRLRAGLTPRERAALDQVCGLDLTLRQAALALRTDPRTLRKALLAALVAADARRRCEARADD